MGQVSVAGSHPVTSSSFRFGPGAAVVVKSNIEKTNRNK